MKLNYIHILFYLFFDVLLEETKEFWLQNSTQKLAKDGLFVANHCLALDTYWRYDLGGGCRNSAGLGNIIKRRVTAEAFVA